MYNYENIRNIHFEVSSLCNAECPVCNRRLSGGPKNPIMTERAVTLEQFKKWFPDDLLKQLDQLLLCGNYGDPMTAPDLIPILTYFREVNPYGTISMNTNAGGRDKKFWEDLSEVIGEFGRVVFSVDGLEDTNHLYRKGVNWKKVMTAMTAFTSTKKARATWEFLVFEHNQHQIAEARELSKKLGMHEFWAKKAMGFMNSDIGKPVIRALNIDGSFAYNLHSPDEEWQNEAIKNPPVKYKPISNNPESNRAMKLEDITQVFDYNNAPFDLSFSPMSADPEGAKKIDNCDIVCEALNWAEPGTQSVFVSSTGIVFPCCFTASKYIGNADYETMQLRAFVDSYGEETITLSDTKNLKDILESDLMQNGYVNRWNKNSIDEGKLYTCGIFCGKDVNTELKSTKESMGQ
jgi:MoaA/NifB/PqqE/SkfB family radical SAM enzyme